MLQSTAATTTVPIRAILLNGRLLFLALGAMFLLLSRPAWQPGLCPPLNLKRNPGGQPGTLHEALWEVGPPSHGVNPFPSKAGTTYTQTVRSPDFRIIIERRLPVLRAHSLRTVAFAGDFPVTVAGPFRTYT